MIPVTEYEEVMTIGLEPEEVELTILNEWKWLMAQTPEGSEDAKAA